MNAYNRKRMGYAAIDRALAADVVPLVLEGIIFLAKQIRQVVKNVAANRQDYFDLDREVQEVVGFFQHMINKWNETIPDLFIQPVNDLHAVLEQCLEFLQKFADATKYRHLYKNSTYRSQFEYLNRRLYDCKQRIMFGIAICQYVGPCSAQPIPQIAPPSSNEQRRRRRIVQPLNPEATSFVRIQ